MDELIETNILLTKILNTCQKSVGNYVFSQILHTAKITPEEYDMLVEYSQNPYQFYFSVHLSLN